MDQIDDKSLELERLPHSKSKLDQKASKRAPDELEQQVNERTTQLSAINTQLINEIAERERAEIELTLVKDELAADLKTMLRLHELSTRLLKSTELQPLLEEILDAIIELLHADFGNVQLCNPQSKALEIVAQRGFKQDFLDYFSSVHEDSAACGRAIQHRRRVVIDDVETDSGFAPHREIAASAGFRAVQFTPLFSRSGEPLGMISTHFRQPHHPSEHDCRFMDLYAHLAAEFIERKRAEEKLRRNEIYLAEGQRLSHTASWAWKVSTGEVYWSAELFRIYGLDPDKQRPGYPDVLKYIHPEDRARAQTTFEDAVREQKAYELAYRIVWANGTIRHVNNLAHPVFNERGTLLEYVGTTIDTTERVQAEERVRKAYERVDMILESISDNFFGLDKEGRFTFFNKHAAEQMRTLGRDPDALIGRVAWEEFPDMPNKENVLRVLSEHVVIVDEVYYAPLEEWVENHMYPSSDGGLVSFQKYITERKRTEEELRKTQAELAHVTRVTTLGELTVSIAHEVNQPLGAIVTNGHACLRLLSRTNPDIDEARRAVECMIADGIRASEVIKRIRGLLKKSRSGKSSCNINDNIREVLALTAGELTKNGINVQTELAHGLPYVIADRVQIQQVVLNLILNSKEAMSGAGWQPRELLIRSEQAGPEIVVTVTDTGVGIDPENRERIFVPFFTSKEGGLGFGLSISQTIVEAHGGRLWTKPGHNGQGTTFQFSLPTGKNLR